MEVEHVDKMEILVFPVVCDFTVVVVGNPF